MEELFRLEFNEKQQMFHHSYPHQRNEPNTFGWHTITDFCSDDEWNIFEAYVNRDIPHHRTMSKKPRLTLEYVLKSFSELNSFIKNLAEYKMSIRKL